MHLDEEHRSWFEVTAEWRKKYPIQRRPYNPANVSCSTKQCAKCESTWKITRHHKGHEYYFAVIKEEWYAERYIQFYPEDVVPLCERCHLKVHMLYQPVMDEVLTYVRSGAEITKEALEKFRKRLVQKCDKWLLNKIKKPTASCKKRLS